MQSDNQIHWRCAPLIVENRKIPPFIGDGCTEAMWRRRWSILLVKTIFEKIVEINQRHGITILLVEQNANLALQISHYGYVLESGRITSQDTSAALRQNPQVKSAYLGG